MGDDLLVATQLELNASDFNLLVYSLADPLTPTLVSNTTIPYEFLTDMFVLGNVALFPTETIGFLGARAIFPGKKATSSR